MEIQLVIKGRPISKKNSKRIIRRGGYPSIISSEAYEKFEANTLAQLLEKRVGRIAPPYEVGYTFFMKGKLDSDIDNMQAGFNDILKTAGIIEDDKHIMLVRACKIPNCKDWETILKIKHYAPNTTEA